MVDAHDISMQMGCEDSGRVWEPLTKIATDQVLIRVSYDTLAAPGTIQDITIDIDNGDLYIVTRISWYSFGNGDTGLRFDFECDGYSNSRW